MGKILTITITILNLVIASRLIEPKQYGWAVFIFGMFLLWKDALKKGEGG